MARQKMLEARKNLMMQRQKQLEVEQAERKKQLMRQSNLKMEEQLQKKLTEIVNYARKKTITKLQD